MKKIFLTFVLILNVSLIAMDKSQEDKLRQAVCQDDEKAVTELIQAGVSPDIMINIGEEPITLLAYTVYKQFSNLFKQLIELGADVNHKDFSILHWMAKEHLYFKRNSNQDNGHYWNPILDSQIYLLICSGVDTNRRNGRGKTAYEEACANDFRILINPLLKYETFLQETFFGHNENPIYKQAGQRYKKKNEDLERQEREDFDKRIRESREKQNECCIVM